jgi:IS5 family transposase
MKHADQLLADPQIVAPVYEALAKRHRQSRTRGRPGTPAEVVLRLLVLKHMRNWSYGVLEREVRANLVYRDFTRVGATKMPDAKTMSRWGLALGPEVVEQIHQRIVQIARDHRVAAGRRMRVDTTVVETNIHYPTDSSLLGDGVRVLTRTMQKITKIAGAVGAKLRDRSRSVKLRMLEIARAARARGQPNRKRLALAYQKLLGATGRVVGQAKRFAKEIDKGVKQVPNLRRQLVLERLRRELETMVPRVQQVMRQTRARIFAGDTHAEGKMVSLFEPTTEVIRKSLPPRKRGERPASRPNSARLSSCRRPRTRSSSPTRSTISGPAIRIFYWLRSTPIRRGWGARRTWWPPMPGSTQAKTRPRQRPRVSSACASPIAPPKTRSASASKRSAGSATGRSGGLARRAASAWSSGGTD